MRSNHPYRHWHHSQFINRCMGVVDVSLYKQPSKGTTSILTTQYCKDVPPWMKEKWHTFILCLGWCMMYHELQLSIHVLTAFLIHLWVHGWGWYIIIKATKKQEGHIHTGHTIPQGWTSMDERKVAHFFLLPNMECDVPWAPTIHICVDTPPNSSICSWMVLIYHCTSSQAMGSHPYWPHNTTRIDHG